MGAAKVQVPPEDWDAWSLSEGKRHVVNSTFRVASVYFERPWPARHTEGLGVALYFLHFDTEYCQEIAGCLVA